MSEASHLLAQNGTHAVRTQFERDILAPKLIISFIAPSQQFTASAPPTAAASGAPTPTPFVPPTSSTTIHVPATQPAIGQGLTNPPTAPDQGRSLRKRSETNASSATNGGGGGGGGGSAAERTTRSGTSFSARPRWMPKLKLKVNESADGRRQSFLGPYDRDLDSSDEELVFEEHFILRLPEGKDCERLKDLVNKRAPMPDVWMKFKGLFYPLQSLATC